MCQAEPLSSSCFDCTFVAKMKKAAVRHGEIGGNGDVRNKQCT